MGKRRAAPKIEYIDLKERSAKNCKRFFDFAHKVSPNQFMTQQHLIEEMLKE